MKIYLSGVIRCPPTSRLASSFFLLSASIALFAEILTKHDFEKRMKYEKKKVSFNGEQATEEDIFYQIVFNFYLLQ